MAIDLNCDLGESFGAYTLGLDQQVMQHITSANVACGWHAGDPMVMDLTVRTALAAGVGIGAHPGFPDLMGFGRRGMDCSPQEIENYVIYQVGALAAFCKAHGARLSHVKPHGALYLLAAEDQAVARAVTSAVAAVDDSLAYVALAGAKGSMAAALGDQQGLTIRYEAFPDRAYTPDGTLVSRREPGAVIKDPAEVAARALAMAKQGVVTAVDGSMVELQPDTLCVHGDNPNAVELVKTIKEHLQDNGVEIAPMGDGGA